MSNSKRKRTSVVDGRKRKRAETSDPATAEQLESLPNCFLQELCVEYGIKKTGKRSVLVERLVESGCTLDEFREAQQRAQVRKDAIKDTRKQEALELKQSIQHFYSGQTLDKTRYDQLQVHTIYKLQSHLVVDTNCLVVFETYFRVAQFTTSQPFEFRKPSSKRFQVHTEIIKSAVARRLYRVVRPGLLDSNPNPNPNPTTSNPDDGYPFVLVDTVNGADAHKDPFAQHLESDAARALLNDRVEETCGPDRMMAHRPALVKELQRLCTSLSPKARNWIAYFLGTDSCRASIHRFLVQKNHGQRCDDIYQFVPSSFRFAGPAWWKRSDGGNGHVFRSNTFALPDDLLRVLPLVLAIGGPSHFVPPRPSPLQYAPASSRDMQPSLTIQIERWFRASPFDTLPRDSFNHRTSRLGDDEERLQYVIDERAFALLQGWWEGRRDTSLVRCPKDLAVLIWEYVVLNHMNVYFVNA